jgi:hypothetical protein
MPPSAPLTTIVTATLAGGPKPNQDHIVLIDHAVAVLDGASSWLPQAPGRDGGWYARNLCALLTTLLSDDSRDLADIVGEAIAEMRDRHQLVPGESPSSTLTIARWGSETLEVYALGDSPAVIYPNGGGEPIVVYDNRLENVGTAERLAYRDHLRSGAGYDGRLRTLVAALQLAERTARNRPDGYWIAESDPVAAKHAITACQARKDVGAVLILSDGAAAAVGEYHLHDWAGVRTAIAGSGPEPLLRSLHDVEQQDSDGVRWPRAKRHDDKTMVVVRFHDRE